MTQVSQMTFEEKDGIEYAAAPDALSGFIKIKPGGEKSPRASAIELVCVFFLLK